MKRHYHFRYFAVGLLALFCTFFSTFQANAQGTFGVRFVLDGITTDNADAIRGMQIYYSADERLISYEDPNRYRALSELPSNVDFPYSKASIAYVGGYCTNNLYFNNTTSNKVYYRYYSPYFTDVQTGCAELDASTRTNVVYLHPLQNKKAIKVTPVKGRDGKNLAEYAFYTNTAKAYYGNGGGSAIINGIQCYNYGEDDAPFYIYAEKGTTLHYAVNPYKNTDCALAVRTLKVTNDDTPQVIDTDYSKAKKLRLFVADSKGNYIKMEEPRLQNTFYDDQCTNYGWGALISMPLDFELKESTDGSHNWMETYALPESKQNFEIYAVSDWSTTDPDFIFPYNCPQRYLVKEVAVTDDARPQDVLMGKSEPRDVIFRLKGATEFSNILYPNVEAYYDFKYYPVKDNQKWGAAHYKRVSCTTEGEDLVFHLKVNAAAPYVRISPKVDNYLVYRDTLWKANAAFNEECFNLPKEGDTYTNQKVVDLSKVHAVNFVARHDFLKDNKVALHADCFENDESFTHFSPYHKWGSEAIDTITVYLAEGDYEWYTISSSTSVSTSDKHAFHVGSATEQYVIVDEVLSDILSAKNADNAAEPQSIFTLEGKRISTPQRGVNIIRMSDGSVRKINK